MVISIPARRAHQPPQGGDYHWWKTASSFVVSLGKY